LEWRPGNYFYSVNNVIEREVHHPGNTHAMALWRREVLECIQGYPAGRCGGEDQEFNAALARAGIGMPRGEIIPSEDIFYIYRWGFSPTHLSSRADGPPNDPQRPHYEAIGRQKIVPGTYYLAPQWRRNYSQDADTATGIVMAAYRGMHAPTSLS
jgi:hypothetical protein